MIKRKNAKTTLRQHRQDLTSEDADMQNKRKRSRVDEIGKAY